MPHMKWGITVQERSLYTLLYFHITARLFQDDLQDYHHDGVV